MNNLLSGKTFIVSGATGRLGCEAVNRLEELGADVFPIVLEGYSDKPELINWSSSQKPISIKSTSDLKLLPKADYVINFHWTVNRNLSFSEQLFFEIYINLYVQSFFWNWVKDNCLKNFINISSIKVFSSLNTNPISRHTEPFPGTPYGIAKLTAEKYFDAFFNNDNFRITHLRLGSIAAFKEFPTQLLTQLYDSAFNNKKIKINCNHSTSIIYIKEVIDTIISAAIGNSFGKYIIAKPMVENTIIAQRFSFFCGKKINAEYVDFEPNSIDPTFVSDIKLFYESWTRIFSLDELIADYLSCYTNN